MKSSVRPPIISREVRVGAYPGRLGDTGKLGRLLLPDVSVAQGELSWTFFLPPSGMGLPDAEEKFRWLFERLVSAGLAVYLVPALRTRDYAWLGDHLEAASEQPRLARSSYFLLGMGEGADHIAHRYYEFLKLGEPRAAVLLSPSIDAGSLNQITCPYLSVHGGLDPRLKVVSFRRVVDAIQHHRDRFTDVTKTLCFADLDHELGGQELDPRVAESVADWIFRAAKTGHRPQEPVVSGPSRKLSA